MKLQGCKDGTCQAYDCDTCNPGNDDQQERYDAYDEHMCDRGDAERDARCD